jgi:hypothetical protein
MKEHILLNVKYIESVFEFLRSLISFDFIFAKKKSRKLLFQSLFK